MISKNFELTFEQQQHIDNLGAKAYTPSSNSNKYRHELYDYINKIANNHIVAKDNLNKHHELF